MSKCDLMYACSFYRRSTEAGTSLGVLYRRAYCEKNWQQCARYGIARALGPHHVPPDLYPNMADRARQMLSATPGPVERPFDSADS